MIEPLGAGGQGAVWKVADPVENAVRALKLFSLQQLEGPDAERARREARAVADASHPSLVPCRGLFELPSERLVGLVFDFVAGRSLADAARDPRMSPEHRRAALVHLAGVLAHVHQIGVVHRDLKPANLLITDTFWPAPHDPSGLRLLDFGIAARAGNPRPLTATGAVIGTLAYMAPELLAPSRWRIHGGGFQRDLFAFGVLAWELLHGVHPTGLDPSASSADFVAVYLAADTRRHPWPPADVPGPLGAALRACLELDAARRPPNGAALLTLLTGGPAAYAPTSSNHPPATPPTATHAGPRTSLDPSHHARASSPSLPGPPASVPIAFRNAPAPEDPRATRTTPMPSPPSGAGSPALSGLRTSLSAHSVPRSSLHSTAPETLPSREPSARASLLLTLGIVLGALGTAAGVWMVLGRAPRSASTTESAPPPVMPPSAPAAADPGSQAPARAALPTPCCKPSPQSCVSPERACSAGPGCEDSQLPEHPFFLRLIGAAERPPGSTKYTIDMAEMHPSAEVCVRRVVSGNEVCASFSEISAPGGARSRRLPITTADVTKSGLEIRIREGEQLLAQGRNASNHGGVTSAILCQGMLLYVGPRDQASVRLGIDLDPL
ncbi:serine/threonine-protein kinase [Chondromyces crocatus]|uniref:serine/threonine-protein kinase n=1 Tax=Chondromyces crocatus TaxID=52 RepID=UPI00146FCE2A|nr:serine/threonine-protein kinase [Chondromyces crocatus]